MCLLVRGYKKSPAEAGLVDNAPHGARCLELVDCNLFAGQSGSVSRAFGVGALRRFRCFADGCRMDEVFLALVAAVFELLHLLSPLWRFARSRNADLCHEDGFGMGQFLVPCCLHDFVCYLGADGLAAVAVGKADLHTFLVGEHLVPAIAASAAVINSDEAGGL